MGTPRYTISLETKPDDSAAQILRDGLSRFNRDQIGRDAGDDQQPLQLFVRTNDGSVVGGLLGTTYWGWLAIHIVWLEERLRGHQLGSDLLRMAEQEALKRGCHSATLDTMSFQAQGFYQRLGYEVVAQLDDFPPGHRKIFMKKRLRTD